MDTLKLPYTWPDVKTNNGGPAVDPMESTSLITNIEGYLDFETGNYHIEAPAAISQRTEHLFSERIRYEWVYLSWAFQTMLMNTSKRALDILLCILILPVVFPVMIIIAIAIRIESPGWVIFKQERVGKRGKTFQCYKFRSMVKDAEARKAELLAQNEADEVVFKMKRDPRITRVGHIIRKLSMDELPQFYNVLKGEMSFVGPRPPVPFEVQQYKVEYLRRLEVQPGITGLQQVSGRSDIEFKRWVELDIEYIRESSLLKDIEILMKTIPAVISCRGAY